MPSVIRGDDNFDSGTEQVTTSSVLSATAGASVGAVGTYAYLRRSGATTADLIEGSTYAGSTLRYNGYYSATALGNTVQYASVNGGTPAGTWRAMGRAEHPSASVMTQTLFLRIS
jgi:hypothetical protein